MGIIRSVLIKALFFLNKKLLFYIRFVFYRFVWFLTLSMPEGFPRLCQSVFHGCARPFLLCVLSLEATLEIGF